VDFPQAARARVPIACVLVDIDHFRRVNDRFGHAFGDAVLQQFTRLLRLMLRGGDLICRYGGDQFMLMLNGSNATQAAIVAERIRLQLKREVFSDGSAAAAITASFGVAVAPAPDVRHPGQMIERVESALFEAKRGGRDRISIDPAALEAAALAEAAQAARQMEARALLTSEPEERPDA
jgi:diguanylate cyclase (GGDEF)-like protein